METMLRHWTLLRCVKREPQRKTARELTAELTEQGFSVTKRSVERDLQNLSVVFPLYCDDRGSPYGWCWKREAPTFDIPGMGVETALTFVVMDRFARHLLPTNVTEAFAPHVERARQVLSSLDDEFGAGAWPERVRFLSRSLPLHPPAVDPGVTDVVYRALLQGKCFTAGYRSRAQGGDQAREYVVNPLGLVFRDEVTYVVGTLWQYDDIRQLALHRFEWAELLDEAAAHRPDFDLDDYIAEGHFQVPYTDQTLKLRARVERGAAFHLRETALAEDQVLEPVDDHNMELRATVHDTQQLRWWLLGFGPSIEVLKPAKLRREIAQTAKAAAALYQ